jgi:predicted nucleic acid-binding protein
MTVPGERSFIDTNILVYALEPQPSPKKARAKTIMESALNARDGVISFQIVQEFLSVALRKFRPPMTMAEAQSYLERVLMPLCAVFPGAELYYEALSITDETGWSFYDSLMVSAALAARCNVILTEDLQHGRRIRGAEIRNPFL